MTAPNKKLDGKRIAFTGRLATMTRAEAEAVVREQGGVPDQNVSRHTSLLVVGQEGWPLQNDGRLTAKLVRANRLIAIGYHVGVITELEWLSILGLEDSADTVRRHFTLAQLAAVLKIPRSRLQSWIRAELVESVETLHGVPMFDYQQVANLRTLWQLTQAGVSMDRLRQSLEQLERWFPRVGACPSLSLLQKQGRVLVRLDSGALAEPSGQMQLDFGDDAPHAAVVEQSTQERSAADRFERGCTYEEAGDLLRAAIAYREALTLGDPQPQVFFNLGNVLYAQGQLREAVEQFRQAVQLDGRFAEAWNNLGNVHADLEETDQAVSAFKQAVAARPDYADAHYNLADTFQSLHRFSEARRHWKEYLRLEPQGEWARYARRCLNVGG